MKNKKTVIVVVIIITALVSGALIVKGMRESPDVRIATEGLSAPDFTLQDMDGKSWRLSSFKGSVVIVNFWATWCESCRLEMPELQKLYETTKGSDKLRILTVLFRDDPARAAAYMNQ